MFADEPFRAAAAPVGGELDQLGPGDGPGRLLRHVGRRRSAPRPSVRSRSSCPPATSATSTPATSPGAWACPSTSWSSPRTATTSSPASSRPARMALETVVPTCSPSMDIQVSSNLERLLWEVLGRGRRGGEPSCWAASGAEGSVALDPAAFGCAARGVRRPPGRRRRHAGRDRVVPGATTACSSTPTPRSAWPPRHRWPRPRERSHRPGRWWCWPPPTRPSSPTRSSGPPASVPPLPDRLADLLDRPERFTVVANDLGDVERFVTAHARVVSA